MYPKGYMSLPDKVAGEETICETCGHTIVCRMTTYSNYENYLQWQNAEKGAHFSSSGKCKTLPGDRRTQKEEPDSEFPEPNPLAKHPKSDPTEIKPKFPNIRSELHDEAWAFAMQEATKIVESMVSMSEPTKQTLILAQVFYKKHMDYFIHVKCNPLIQV